MDLIEESAQRGVFAVDMALELRVMGGSDVLMAPQYGNRHGTLSIEPVSTRMVHKEVWEDFKVELARWSRSRNSRRSRRSRSRRTSLPIPEPGCRTVTGRASL